MSGVGVTSGRRLLARRPRFERRAEAGGSSPQGDRTTDVQGNAPGEVQGDVRRDIRGYAPMVIVADVAAGLVATALCLGPLATSAGIDPSFAVDAAVAIVAFVVVTALRGGYRSQTLASRVVRRDTLTTTVSVVAVLGAAAAATSLTVHLLTLVVVLPAVVVVGYVARSYVRWRVRSAYREGVGVRRVLAVGRAADIDQLVAQLSESTSHAFVVVGACLDGDDPAEPGIPVVGKLPADDEGADPLESSTAVEAVVAAVESSGAQVVCFSDRGALGSDHLRALRWALADRGVAVMSSVGLNEVAPARAGFVVAGRATLVRVDPVRLRGPAMWIKRGLDPVVATFLAVAASPLLLGIALAVKLSSPGPVFFTQTRVGADGSRFTMMKFRTMVTGAHAMRMELEAQNEHDGGPMFKMADDPRVTRVGRALRRTSLDELPQLFNVIAGQMSLVGPRPALPEEVDRYRSPERRRLRVQPGMTGLWQVSGRSSLSWAETVRLDLYYVDNWCLALDVRLMWRTVEAVLRGTGAH